MFPGRDVFAADAAKSRKRHVLVAGGGIAGLSAALALEQRGFAVTVFERSAEPASEGAGLQLSPNAARLLASLKVLPRLTGAAVHVRQVLLMSGAAAAPLLQLDVSNAAQRWGAPYLAIRRADLATALADEARTRPAITLKAGSQVTHFAAHANGVTVSVTGPGGISEAGGIFLVGADGVWSRIRGELTGIDARNSGFAAFRNTAAANSALPGVLRQLLAQGQIAAFLAPRAHLVAYPVRDCSALNLVAIGRQPQSGRSAELPDGFKRFSPDLAAFLHSLKDWTQWPIHTVSPSQKWSEGKRVLLIGDAAHAIAPYGAQGAAMAIEDAWTLAACLAAHRDDLSAAVVSYEKHRRPRIRRVAARTSANRFAYHASGPAAWARDALFRARGQKMLDGLDWIYGWQAPA